MSRRNSQVRNSRVQNEPIAVNPVRKSGMCDKLCKCLKQKCCCKNTETPEEAMENFQQNVNNALKQVFLNNSDQRKVKEDTPKDNTGVSMMEGSNQESGQQDYDFNMDWYDKSGKLSLEKFLPKLTLAMDIKDNFMAYSTSRGYFVHWTSESLYLYQVKDDCYSEVQGFFPMKMEPGMNIYRDRNSVTFSTDERRLIILTVKGVVVSDFFDEPLPLNKIFKEKSPSRRFSGLSHSKQIKVQSFYEEGAPLEERARIPPPSLGLYNTSSHHATGQPVPELTQIRELDENLAQSPAPDQPVQEFPQIKDVDDKVAESPAPAEVVIADDYPYKLIKYEFKGYPKFVRVFFFPASFSSYGYGHTNIAREEYIDPRPKYLVITVSSFSKSTEVIFENIDNVLTTASNDKDSNDPESKHNREKRYGVEIIEPGECWGRLRQEREYDSYRSFKSSICYSRHYEAVYIVTTKE
jgi:hypothetical protein